MLCPRVVFDVNMLGAWLSFVVIGLSAQQENSYRGGGVGGSDVRVCVCVRERVKQNEKEGEREQGRIEWGISATELGLV